MSESNDSIKLAIEVAFAKPDDYRILQLQVNDGTTVLDAARQSGMSEHFPEIDWESAKLGIFGKSVPKPGEQAVREGDRIEIYRPLIADPKAVRKKRAEQAKLKAQA